MGPDGCCLSTFFTRWTMVSASATIDLSSSADQWRAKYFNALKSLHFICGNMPTIPPGPESDKISVLDNAYKYNSTPQLLLNIFYYCPNGTHSSSYSSSPGIIWQPLQCSTTQPSTGNQWHGVQPNPMNSSNECLLEPEPTEHSAWHPTQSSAVENASATGTRPNQDEMPKILTRTRKQPKRIVTLFTGSSPSLHDMT